MIVVQQPFLIDSFEIYKLEVHSKALDLLLNHYFVLERILRTERKTTCRGISQFQFLHPAHSSSIVELNKLNKSEVID
ncbi:hypothetical protein D3C77_327940 [compost metagenome]